MAIYRQQIHSPGTRVFREAIEAACDGRYQSHRTIRETSWYIVGTTGAPHVLAVGDRRSQPNRKRRWIYPGRGLVCISASGPRRFCGDRREFPFPRTVFSTETTPRLFQSNTALGINRGLDKKIRDLKAVKSACPAYNKIYQVYIGHFGPERPVVKGTTFSAFSPRDAHKTDYPNLYNSHVVRSPALRHLQGRQGRPSEEDYSRSWRVRSEVL